MSLRKLTRPSFLVSKITNYRRDEYLQRSCLGVQTLCKYTNASGTDYKLQEKINLFFLTSIANWWL